MATSWPAESIFGQKSYSETSSNATKWFHLRTLLSTAHRESSEAYYGWLRITFWIFPLFSKSNSAFISWNLEFIPQQIGMRTLPLKTGGGGGSSPIGFLQQLAPPPNPSKLQPPPHFLHLPPTIHFAFGNWPWDKFNPSPVG